MKEGLVFDLLNFKEKDFKDIKAKLENDVLDLENKIKEIKKTNKELHVENKDQQELVNKLLYRYVPKKCDPIDDAVATFINSYPEKEGMKILFLRESTGVYRFGKRRV